MHLSPLEVAMLGILAVSLWHCAKRFFSLTRNTTNNAVAGV
jgi:hypothetical protein